MNKVILSDLTTSCTIIIHLTKNTLFFFIDWLNSLGFMGTKSKFSNINYTMNLLKLSVSFSVKVILKEVFTLILLLENPSMREEFIMTKALRLIGVLFSISNHGFSNLIFPIQSTMTWDMIIYLWETSKVLSNVLMVV